jgi:hypothetical protein
MVIPLTEAEAFQVDEDDHSIPHEMAAHLTTHIVVVGTDTEVADTVTEAHAVRK